MEQRCHRPREHVAVGCAQRLQTLLLALNPAESTKGTFFSLHLTMYLLKVTEAVRLACVGVVAPDNNKKR